MKKVILGVVFVSYVAKAQLSQDCNGLKVVPCGNKIQACASAEINVLGVPITLPNMALWNPCCPIPVHLREAFQQDVNKMLSAGVLKPVQEATPWINSFVLVEGNDESGNLKLRICLDLTNLNNVMVREPYHFKTPEDIVHLLADACIMTACYCKKGNWHQQLDEASSFLQLSIHN